MLVGTLYPMALEALTGDKISVGGPFFNSTVVWIFMPLLLAVPFGLFLAWKRGNLGEAAKRLGVAAIIAVIAGACGNRIWRRWKARPGDYARSLGSRRLRLGSFVAGAFPVRALI